MEVEGVDPTYISCIVAGKSQEKRFIRVYLTDTKATSALRGENIIEALMRVKWLGCARVGKFLVHVLYNTTTLIK